MCDNQRMEKKTRKGSWILGIGAGLSVFAIVQALPGSDLEILIGTLGALVLTIAIGIGEHRK